jgi:predicted nucleotidyltransferase
MASVFDKLMVANLIKPPTYLKNNVIYEVITGSHAYGTNLTDKSDFDIYGVGIPPRDMIFTHLRGEIPGFGRQIQRFEQFSQHHIQFSQDKEYDITIYSIIKYFQLCMDNNPNMVDTLFVPQECIVYSNSIGNMIREKRKIFLHKGSYHKFLGYAHSQLHKMASPDREGKRKEIFDKFGFDVKFAMHLVRLAYEAEQILVFGDLDLRKHNEHLKSIRRGDVTEKDIREWFASKEKDLEKLYQESKLQHSPDEQVIKQLLIDCLEHHYGSLEKCVVIQDKYEVAVKEIRDTLSKLGL